MPVHFPDEANSSQQQRVILWQDIFFSRGWLRHMPVSSILFAGAFQEGPQSREQLALWVENQGQGESSGWDADAWDPPAVWTEDEWSAHCSEFSDGPFAMDAGEPVDAAAANAEAAREHENALAQSDRYSAALGVAPVRTLVDVLNYMKACGVVVEYQEDGRTFYDLNSQVGLPGEVLPLSKEDHEREDSMRWRDVHDPTSNEIINLFNPRGDEPIDQKRTSLARLARELDSDVESVRQGVLFLLEEGDFGATVNPATVAPNETFDLVVDWDLFYSKRIFLSFAGGESEDDASPPAGDTEPA